MAYSNRARANLRLRDRSKALADCTQAITLNRYWGSGGLAEALRLRGTIYPDQKNIALAIEDFQPAVEQYDRQGKPEHSQQVMNKILRLKIMIK